jgi:C4-dicarboxylate-specific signal transduction histidine kinase
MQRGVPNEIARSGVVIVVAALAVASLLVPLHLEGLRLALGVATVVGLAAALIMAPAERRRRAQLERTRRQLEGEIAEKKRVEAESRRREEFLIEVQRLSRTRSWISPITPDPVPSSADNFRVVGLDQANPAPPIVWNWDVVHAEDRERVQTIIGAAIRERKGYEFDHRIVLPDGSVRIIHVRSQPVVDAAGAVTEYIGTSTDITKRRAAEETLRKSEQRYRTIFESAGSAIIEEDFTRVMAVLDEIRSRVSDLPRYLDEHPEVVSQTLRLIGITDANYAAARLFGADNPRQLLNDVSVLMSTELEAAWVVLLRAIAEGKRIVETELVLTTLRNEKISTLVTIVLPDPSSGYESVLCTFVDLTERNRAQDALHHAQATLAHATRVTSLGELTASIAHEVNQPLAAILNNANACVGLLSIGGAAELEETRAALADIAVDAERASSVIERVRALARRSPPERQFLHLADVVGDVVILAARELAMRGVAIRRNAVAPLPVVLGDRVQLQQVLLNMVVNGMDAMAALDEGERLLEITEYPETLDGRSAATIRVRDRGVGLSSAESDRLFEAFYTTKPNGMGMGLAISRSIIEAHGGRMWAEPNAGPGASFGFTLYAADTGAM